MKQEQIHDALNLLDDDLIEAVDALRDKAGLNSEFPEERNCEQNKQKSWMKYMSLAACLCVVIIGAFVWQRYKVNFLNDDKCDGVGNTAGNNEELDGMPGSDTLAGGTGQGYDGEVADGDATDSTGDGAIDININIGEVPSVLVRIDEWQEDGFVGVVAGLVDTDIFSMGADIRVIFNENISVGILIGDGMKFENKVPDKADFPIGSIVRVQFVKFEHATEGATDITEHENVIYAELIVSADVSE